MGIPISKYSLPNGLVRVYNWDQRPGLGTQPSGYVTREDANKAVKLKMAVPCVKGFAIHLKPDPQRRFKKFLRIVIHGTSCTMGPRVTHDACDEAEPGHKLAKAAAEAYLMIWAGSYCPLLLAKA